jgi:hypothetical protein
MPEALGNWVAAYLCSIMLVLGIIIVIGLCVQKANKNKK